MTRLIVSHEQHVEVYGAAVLRPSHRWRQEHVRMFFEDELWITKERVGLYVGFWLHMVENEFSFNTPYD